MAKKESNSKAISVRLKHYNTAKTRFQINHDERNGKQPSYVDGNRSYLNTCAGTMSAKDYAEVMLERRKLTSPKRAANMNRAAIMTGGIITFGHLAQSAVEALSPAEQDAMCEGIAVAIASELDNEVTGLSIHRDEAAVHAHFQMPSRRREDGRLMSEVLSPALTSKLQDLAAEFAQVWIPEMERGAPKADTKARNKPVKELHRTATVDLESKHKAIAAAKLKLEKNERLAAAARQKSIENEDRAAKHLKNAQAYERRAKTAQTEIDELNLQIERLEAEAQRATQSAREARREASDLELRQSALRERNDALQASITDKEARLGALENEIEMTGDGLVNFEIAMDEVHKTTQAAFDQTLTQESLDRSKQNAFADRRGNIFRFASDDQANGLVITFINRGFNKAIELFNFIRNLSSMNEALKDAKTYPEPQQQLINHISALKETVGSILQEIGVTDESYDLGYQDETGDPPPVLELIFSLAKQKANKLNQELANRLGLSGPGI